MNFIGIDIGASKTKFVFLKNKKVFRKKSFLTPKIKNEIIEKLEKEIYSTLNLEQVSGIGIAVPSTLSKNRSTILNPTNLACLKNCELGKIIEGKFKIKTIIENDANCFTLGEAILGAGIGADAVIGITLGSGVGGGIFFNSSIYYGAFGSAGEIGYMTINLDKKNNYTFEDCCSEKFFIKKDLKNAKKAKELAEKGSVKAIKAYNEYGRYLGIGISDIINIFDPEVIVIGGGISKAHKFFLEIIKKEIQKNIGSPVSRKYVKIKITKLGNFAGALGATLLFRKTFK
ncbi:MAG: ROK family protein [Patescibacteria group bacterium]|nr:ROK family protein [Patescibacteria group bacterium]